MLVQVSLVTFTVSGRGWTDLALTTLPSDVATMCSPEENCNPTQIPSNQRSVITPPWTVHDSLCMTGVPNA